MMKAPTIRLAFFGIIRQAKNAFCSRFNQMKKILSVLLSLVFANIAFAQENLPKVQREFRGMWIATVSNLDFPSSPNLTADQQKAEIVKLMDLAVSLKLNAVVFQVSSMRDAVYQSDLEPWSEFLTGTMGKKADFDPLKFAIDEAHDRGIVLHAWFNPYRASHASAKGEAAENHVTKRHPEWIRTYNKSQIIDPAEKDARDYLVNVVADVVKRYDVDGIHFDDYFYPYPDADKNEFPDDKTWDTYKNSGGKLDRAGWRRKNVDDLIEQVSVEIKKIKPQVMFGVSPFGIWKPDEFAGITGLSSYDAIYADSRKWLQEGWVDYLAPQLYWSTQQKGQQFQVLLNWWKNANKKKRHLWAGIATYKIGTRPDYTSQEITTEINTARTFFEDAAGHIHFRALSLAENKDNLRETLLAKAYTKNAVIPASPWLDQTKPDAPQIQIAKNPATKDLRVAMKATGAKPAFRWILQWKDASGWKTTILPASQSSVDIPAQMGAQKFAVSAVDRLGNISEPTVKSVE